MCMRHRWLIVRDGDDVCELCGVSREERPCRPDEHQFQKLGLNGELVCVLCGLTQPDLFITDERRHNCGDEVEGDAPDFDHLQDELAEAISRMSGGDVAGMHINSTLRYLKQWNTEDCNVAKVMRRVRESPESLFRGILTLALYLGLLDNGRDELLSYVASAVGASPSAVSRAEKLLSEGPRYISSGVATSKVVESLEDVDDEWKRMILMCANMVNRDAFGSPEPIICGTTLALTKDVRAILKEAPPHRLEKNRINVPRLRKNLKRLTSAALQKRFGVSPSAARGIEKRMSYYTRDSIKWLAEDLVLYKTKLLSQKEVAERSFQRGIREGTIIRFGSQMQLLAKIICQT